MHLELELRLDACDAARDIEAACAAVLPGVPARARTLVSDGWVELAHEGELPADAPYAVARSLRGGRDFDPSLPSDWHVRSVTHAMRTARGGGEERVGTTVALCRSFRAPDGYREPEVPKGTPA